jgi:hypothetical protein
MKDEEKSMTLFLVGCIPVRLFLTYLSYICYRNTKYMNMIGVLCLFISIGFIMNFTFGLRKTGIETFGKPIWWNDLRPIHGFLYIQAAYFSFYSKENVWKILLLDTMIGLVAFIRHHNRKDL